MAHGLEIRDPFLDKEFSDMAVRIKAEEKMPKTYDGKEKYVLKKAFDMPNDSYLPNEVLWRQKEQFSDGIGYNWIDQLIEYCFLQVADKKLAVAAVALPCNAPTTKEAYLQQIDI